MQGGWLAGLAILTTVAGGATATRPGAVIAQTAASLSDEDALSLVLPPLADGSRPGVHLWARADQAQGPGGAPTVFLVTLYTKQTASGQEEHEVVNYVQYSGGSWAPARPRDDGTLLIDDWAWISLNLTNLTAAASGQGSASRYTVDYTSSGSYSGLARQITLEEVYAADLSLVSSVVLSDTNPPPVTAATAATAATTTATPVPTARPPGPASVAPPAAAASAVVTPVLPVPTIAPASSPSRLATPVTTPTPGLPVR
ncbi:MAG TPA: hypothetical protein VK821_17395 [Dehalococcoidia bacterium]|nr:hypothetical protein [Dehalococcoidia bacterium]